MARDQGAATTQGGGEGSRAVNESPAEQEPPTQTHVREGLTRGPRDKLTSIQIDVLRMSAALTPHLPKGTQKATSTLSLRFQSN